MDPIASIHFVRSLCTDPTLHPLDDAVMRLDQAEASLAKVLIRSEALCAQIEAEYGMVPPVTTHKQRAKQL